MMSVTSGQHADVQVHSRTVGYRIEKFTKQLRVQIPDHGGCDAAVIFQPGPAAQIDCAQCKGVVHGKDEETVTADSRLVSHRLFDGVSEDDSRILHRMMSVHMQVALHTHCQVEQAVSGKAVQHVIEKTDPCLNLAFSASVQIQLDCNIRFLRFPFDNGTPFIHP